jgi:hypothetical protein
MVSMLSRGSITLVVAAIDLFAAFTAANTTPNSSAGDNLTATISGFTISGITYTLDAAGPTLIDTVVFTAQSDHAGPWPNALGTRLGRFTAVALA